jgi:type I restriction enzyme S subunit
MKQNLNSHKADGVKIKELLRKSSDFNVGKIQQGEYKKIGKFPIVDQSKIEIAGYSDNAELLYSGDLPVLIFGDHTTAIKYVDHPFILGADGTKVILPKDCINPKYLFFAILNLNLKPVGYRRHFPILKDCKIKVPEISKQNEIVKKLDSVLVERLPITKNIVYLKDIQRGIVNQIFG